MADVYEPPRLRASTACVACNKKKVRCIFADNNNKCQNCLRHQWPCFQREPKRRGRQPGYARRDRRGRGKYSTPPDAQVSPEASSLPLSAAQEITPPTTAWSLTSETAWKDYDARPARSTVDATWNPYTSITATGGFMERNDYFRDTDSITNDEGALPIPPAETLSEDDVQLLRLQRAFEIPPRAVRESLIDTFMKRCAPWMPIVERSWLQDTENNKPSILLLQAVFLAASRVTSAPAVASYASSHEFYRRAKALFYSGWEKNPLTVVAAVCILHWYNPECPEHVSTNTSSFWRYVGIGLAHQIGLHKEPSNTEGKALRRRLWWSLFARDCLISAGQGRPLAVNLCDSELAPPCTDDFRDSSHRPDLFISYVEICSILGHLTQCCRRDSLTRRTRQSVAKSLQRWIHGLPRSLRLFESPNFDAEVPTTGGPLSSYDFEARQLHIPYFICLIILCRSPSAHHAPSAAAILASAYVVAIFEDFLARDEIQYLGSIFTFYLLATGIGMLSCRRIPQLWSKVAPGMQTIDSSLEQLAKRWPSAMAPLRVLRTIMEKQHTSLAADIPESAVPSLPDEHRAFFDIFGPGLTWAWEGFMSSMTHRDSTGAEDTGPIGYRESEVLLPPVSSRTRGNATAMVDSLPAAGLVDPVNDFQELNSQHALDDRLFQLQYDGIGDWLLNDSDIYGDIML